jgi:hypothetical protein
MAVTTPSLTSTIVSDDGTATPIARSVASARTQSAMIRCPTRGRAASWKSTSHSSWPSAAIAARVESVRVAPPSMTPVTLPKPQSASCCLACPVRPAGITTVIASTPPACSKAATECSTRVRPASTCICLGLSPPNR